MRLYFYQKGGVRVRTTNKAVRREWVYTTKIRYVESAYYQKGGA